MTRMTSLLMTIVAIAVLAGCSSIPARFKPDVETPEWQGAQANTGKIVRDWWRKFDSPELNRLIKTALRHNHKLQASLHRVEQARAQMKQANAALLPSASAGGHVSTKKDINDEPVFTAKPGLSVTARERAATAGINYELDLFGANRARKRAAVANLAQQKHAHDALKLMVMGDVARGYFAVLALQARQRIAGQKHETAREKLDAIKAQYQARQASSAQLIADQKRMVAQAKAELAEIREKRELAENSLAVLLGQPPQAASFKKRRLDSLKAPEMGVLQPAYLLTRRPDIQTVEARLRQANANIGAGRVFSQSQSGRRAGRGDAGDRQFRLDTCTGGLAVGPDFRRRAARRSTQRGRSRKSRAAGQLSPNRVRGIPGGRGCLCAYKKRRTTPHKFAKSAEQRPARPQDRKTGIRARA